MPATFSHRIEVRFRDCDPMGHVNHAVYLTYLEQARFGYWARLLGLRPRDGAGIILARAECDYRAQARFGDALEVRVQVSEIGRSSFGLAYEIVRLEDGVTVAKARTVQVTYDYAAGTSIPIPGPVRLALEEDRRAVSDTA